MYITLKKNIDKINNPMKRSELRRIIREDILKMKGKRTHLKQIIREEIQNIKEVKNPRFSSSLAACCKGNGVVSSFSLDDVHLMAKKYFRKSMIDFIKYSDDPEIYSVWIGGKLDPRYRIIRKGTRYRLELI